MKITCIIVKQLCFKIRPKLSTAIWTCSLNYLYQLICNIKMTSRYTIYFKIPVSFKYTNDTLHFKQLTFQFKYEVVLLFGIWHKKPSSFLLAYLHCVCPARWNFMVLEGNISFSVVYVAVIDPSLKVIVYLCHKDQCLIKLTREILLYRVK